MPTTARRLSAVDPDAAPPVDQPVMPAPPGLAWTVHPVTGERTLIYAAPEQPAPAEEPVTVQAGPDVWPKRLMAGGGAAAAVVAAVGYAGPGLTAAGHAVEAAGIGVGLTAAGVGALALLVKGAVSGGRDRSVNVNVNVTATGGSASSNATAGKRGRR